MTIRTKRGAAKRYWAIIRQCRRDMAGGLMFGMDWSTLRTTWPDRYHELRLLRYWSAFLPD